MYSFETPFQVLSKPNETPKYQENHTKHNNVFLIKGHNQRTKREKHLIKTRLYSPEGSIVEIKVKTKSRVGRNIHSSRLKHKVEHKVKHKVKTKSRTQNRNMKPITKLKLEVEQKFETKSNTRSNKKNRKQIYGKVELKTTTESRTQTKLYREFDFIVGFFCLQNCKTVAVSKITQYKSIF